LTSGHSDAQCPDVKNYKLLNDTGCFIAVFMWQQWASKG